MKKRSLLWISGFTGLSLILCAMGIAFGGAGVLFDKSSEITPVTGNETVPLVVIDPGHGGEDGGCSSDSGVTEKDLNLLMSQSVCDILNAAGYPCVMTRTEDKLLYDMYGDLTDYTGKKKVYDLRNRLRFFEESGAKMLVSIHMNKFPDKQYSGLQVYYSPNGGGSVSLADRIQSYTEKYLQTDNDRLIKKASSIYLLSRTEMPAVLVECGFLSNDAEAASLGDPSYRQKLALCIAAALIDTVDKDSGE